MAQVQTLALNSEIISFVSGQIDSGNIMLLAVVDENQHPILSFRGSTSVYSPDQLCFWARNNAGATIEAIKNNAQVALMYRSKAIPLFEFHGRARLVSNREEKNRVFELSHEQEQQKDPERSGTAVIVDLDRVSGVMGFDDNGPIFCKMER
jgi:uncharacterized pyridoxamine 5'-phosphate oxidase family protein